MDRQLLHTPDGVRDIYNEECERKLVLQERLHRVLLRYGYHPIQTPSFEFFDIFGREIGTTPSKELYKFFDREGNTLVLRPDITPSVARCAAKYYSEEEMPVRLCYMGNTYVNNNSYQGRLKERTQLGAELLGDSSVDADAELLAMAVACLKAAGLGEFQISVGHADFFGGLLDAAGLLEEQETQLRELISNKNFLGVEEFAETLDLPEELRSLFGMFGNFYADAAGLSEVREAAKSYPRIHRAVCNLEELYAILEIYGIARYVSFEPGMISDYRYYTGVVFAGYTFGSGEPVLRGGRYDKLLQCFGRDLASIGFAVVIDQLMAALLRQKITIPLERKTLLIVYESGGRSEAVRRAEELRADGRAVELVLRDAGKSTEDYISYAKRKHIAEVRFV